MLRHEVAGVTLALHPERAVWWESERTLIVADVHLGKAASFRRGGVPIPRGTTDADLTRLTNLVAEFAPQRLIVLGDLVHDRRGLTTGLQRLVAAWRTRHSTLEWLVVNGNHDRRAGELPPEWQVRNVGDRLTLAPFVLRHDPEPAPDGYVLAGHIHPSVALHDDAARTRLRMPCFWFGAEFGVLPAFGRFTGTHTVRPRVGDGVFAVGDGQIAQIATTASPRD